MPFLSTSQGNHHHLGGTVLPTAHNILLEDTSDIEVNDQ
ncbi:hypothetical protein ymoll0001_37870 [Yersinia mollaretii ATCC 43969]|uniref:Uncharacterized protein n=1 Tax=Yersinia mollaretii (strain ATCC 43969 / DSM 18520 / CIP 103324 / CNY 7263 / WAIP 204) TaxID=349967 RepID=A0ABM9Y5V2_YERMW|nr:hypothetical protein ymoll0001_37870 [Yersinia mollaretii ATCC 43969]